MSWYRYNGTRRWQYEAGEAVWWRDLAPARRREVPGAAGEPAAASQGQGVCAGVRGPEAAEAVQDHHEASQEHHGAGGGGAGAGAAGAAAQEEGPAEAPACGDSDGDEEDGGNEGEIDSTAGMSSKTIKEYRQPGELPREEVAPDFSRYGLVPVKTIMYMYICMYIHYIHIYI